MSLDATRSLPDHATTTRSPSTNGHRVTPPGPYRLSTRQFRLQLLVVYGPCFTLLLATQLFGGRAFHSRDLLVLLIGLLAPALSALLFPLLSTDSVHLSDFGIRFRSGFRRHKIRWTDITHLEVRPLLGVRRLVLHTTTGKRRTLPAPQSFADPEFESKAREITDWWLRQHAQR